uniref:Uncharacterized protein n=1 Tax=Anguilla anguilla TaxID=7936 RepID=A0A0E9SQH4_ANGAN
MLMLVNRLLIITNAIFQRNLLLVFHVKMLYCKQFVIYIYKSLY